MKYFSLLILFLICSCSTHKLSIKEKENHIAKLEQKINSRMNSNYGHLIVKYDLLNLMEEASEYSQCPSSKLHQYLIGNSVTVKRDLSKKLRIIDNKIKARADKGNLLELAHKNAAFKLTKIAAIIKKFNVKVNVKQFKENNDIFAILEKFSNSKNKLAELGLIDKYLSAIPLITPLPGAVVTSNFGWRKHPFNAKKLLHKGIDLASHKKAKIYATAQGKVIYNGKAGNYGNLIIIDHGQNFKTYYAHLDQSFVQNNQIVLLGELIGLQGKTGKSTNDHLHYEVRIKDVPCNPNQFINLANECGL